MVVPRAQNSTAIDRAVSNRNTENFRIIDENLFQFDPRKHLIHPILEQDVGVVLLGTHDECRHYASLQVARKLERRAWWPTRGPDIRTYIDRYIHCALFGPIIHSHKLQPTLTYNPFDMLAIDFIGPLPKLTNGLVYIFHITDYFSRYTKSWSTKTNTPADVISKLAEFFEGYLMPMCKYSDQGTHFTSQQTKDFLSARVVDQILSPSGASKYTSMFECNRAVV